MFKTSADRPLNAFLHVKLNRKLNWIKNFYCQFFFFLSISDNKFRHLIHFVCKFFGMTWIVFKSNIINFQIKWTIQIDETGRCDTKTWYTWTEQFTLFVLDASFACEEKFRKWNLQRKMKWTNILSIFSLNCFAFTLATCQCGPPLVYNMCWYISFHVISKRPSDQILIIYGRPSPRIRSTSILYALQS